jgi:hypothetical protein
VRQELALMRRNLRVFSSRSKLPHRCSPALHCRNLHRNRNIRKEKKTFLSSPSSSSVVSCELCRLSTSTFRSLTPGAVRSKQIIKSSNPVASSESKNFRSKRNPTIFSPLSLPPHPDFQFQSQHSSCSHSEPH